MTPGNHTVKRFLANGSRGLVVALPMLAAAAGCTCDKDPCFGDGYQWPASPMCYGYNPTCWRPWPCECPPCPSFALPPELPPAAAPIKPEETAPPLVPPVPAAPPEPAGTVPGDVLPIPMSPLNRQP
jgi:hypothetical protein